MRRVPSPSAFALVVFMLIISQSYGLPSLAFSGGVQKIGSLERHNVSPTASPGQDELQSTDSELRGLIERYTTDRGSLSRAYPNSLSAMRLERFQSLYGEWRARLDKFDFDSLSQDGKVDYLLLKNHLEHERRQLDLQRQQFAELEPLIPFTRIILDLEDRRRRMEPINSAKVAMLLTEMKKQVDAKRQAVAAGLKPVSRNPEATQSEGETGTVTKTVANRAVATINSLRNLLRNWFNFYNGYDPLFTWWAGEPYKAADQALAAYTSFLNERVMGLKADATPTRVAESPARAERTMGAMPGDTSDIVGNPIGRQALLEELAFEMIPYTPEELIAVAEKEIAWCDAEMVKASRELGYGDDWHKALEYVKNLHVEPGKQPQLIRDLALEAIQYLDEHNLVTVPQLARDTWRMEMMTTERQLVNPFFTGGETISVSYPTNTMTHEQKLMSIRGNNIHFSRATVFHELIPGHHLQGFMTARYKPYRSLFNTPFWREGWALYWELLLWDMKFAKTPENRVGMLFWRMHRCARIIFSLSFHLGKMTPQQCIDFLINRVGHEPENATAEVRRSFNGTYTPLYQAAYLLGGLQLRVLHREIVESGKMTNRAFHDLVLKENSIPIEMLRAILTKQRLTRDFKPGWKFYGPNPSGR
jgi:uncharacterized protein (DUF885 family)